MNRITIAILTSLFATALSAEAPMTEGLIISEVKAQKGQTILREKGACVGMTIKNESEHTSIKVRVRITFLDIDDEAFFEDTRFLLIWTGPDDRDTPLRPNYSIKSKRICSTEGIDLDRWKEGNVKIEIIETDTLAQYNDREQKRKEDLKRLEEIMQND